MSSEQKYTPGQVVWETTLRCNLKCIHCYADAECKKTDNENELSKDEIIKLIDDSVVLGCKKLQFTGGEPLLKKDLIQIINHAKKRNVDYIEVFTNGTLLTEAMIKYFAKQGINVAMSIYSHKPDTHDKITGVRGSHGKTIDSLKLLLAYEVPLRCAVVAMKQNEMDLEDTSYFLSRLGILSGPPDPIRPTGRGLNSDFWPEEYGIRTYRTQPDFLFNKEFYEKNLFWNSCWYGKAAVTSLGDVIPCVFARDIIVGNIREQKFSDIMNSKKMLNLWSLNKDKINTCKSCEYRYICRDCRPWAYGTTKSLYSKSPRCTYNPYTGEWKKLHKKQSISEKCIGT